MIPHTIDINRTEGAPKFVRKRIFSHAESEIDNILLEKAKKDEKWMSIEFFPPKNDAGLKKMYDLADHLRGYNPLFADIT